MNQQRGLTVVDLLVALTILALVLTAVYSVFSFQKRTMRSASLGRDVYAQGLIILDRMTRDISGSWLPQESGTSRLVCRFAASGDRLDFITTAVLSPDESAGPGLVEVGYRLEQNDGDDDGTLSLYRRQDMTLDDDPADGGREIVLSRDVRSLALRFLDKDFIETATWEAEKAALLPRAVRITLTLVAENGWEETFSTLVFPPLARTPVRSIKIPSSGELPF